MLSAHYQKFQSFVAVPSINPPIIHVLYDGIYNRHSRKFSDSTRQSLGSGGYAYRNKFEFEEVLHCIDGV
jgi:hypothetical protein